MALFFCQAVMATTADSGKIATVERLLGQDRPVVVAHRGCWQSTAENSLSAINACIRLGTEVVEEDVRSTKDGVLVLIHDETLDRTTNLTGSVGAHSYAEIRRARLRKRDGGPAAAILSESVPSLVDALNLAKGKLVLLLHLKQTNYDQVFGFVKHAAATQRVIFLIEAGIEDHEFRNSRLLAESNFIPVIWECDRSRATQCYRNDEFARAVRDYAPFHPTAFMPVFAGDVLAAQNPAAPGQSSLRILTSGAEDSPVLDPKSIWGPLLAQHVTFILTNHAPELVQYLRDRGLRQ
jgi:glycerophosphoryl diester phosphodiesterase